MKMSIRGAVLFAVTVLNAGWGSAQCDRWQQRVDYTMDVSLDTLTHAYHGTSRLVYANNSPDTLGVVFFHLYFNAFRPGSEMDVRSRTIQDPDGRIGARIAELTPEQQGRLEVGSLTQHGRTAVLEQLGTVLKVTLPKPILPGKSTTMELSFQGQVPVQIRRSGRDNAEQVAYSMSQWYPKLAEYDERGWHAYPYVGREFFGVWGDFDVTIHLDSAFTIAATGELQNPHEIGHGYPTGKKVLKRPASPTLDWHFVAKDVHDFAWAADRDYSHTTHRITDGPLLHFFYKNDPEYEEVWKELPAYMERSFAYMNAHFGTYPWPQYSFVQGGDGGMEYPMMTLITGKRRLGSLVGVSVHESVHSWYYGVLASNEGRYPWMDEGFTEYAGSEVMQELFPRPDAPHASAFVGYEAMVQSGKYEPPSIHADHFITNRAYGTTAYSFGELFVDQLGAVVGERTLKSGLLRYFDVCKFKHPAPIDFERVMEKESGLELDWYFDEWINTTRTLDIGIRSVLGVEGGTRIELERIGEQLMPVDLRIELKDGRLSDIHIPLSLQRGTKAPGSETFEFTELEPWQWTDPTYTFEVPVPLRDLRSFVIDPLQRTADMDRTNNVLVVPDGTDGFLRP
ncbi:MAG: M1 family metallopeptidase [Flavobacteriales bacterium]|nr:M1 family metallopeptidase [Flavobacteriales bacterium]MBK6549572.1 M1 family metallopeptidase [Flavobacteriales bacterium]MBK6883840.1 M1 family metallopeptidase [Flavobacteriales bacterium]MBK7100232.1 M1 family metallopeptidase [Flavobacteriales bacterium]MBK7110925.1 M1 family metallopeptidase [Flavobacteriales bacterium]